MTQKSQTFPNTRVLSAHS